MIHKERLKQLENTGVYKKCFEESLNQKSQNLLKRKVTLHHEDQSSYLRDQGLTTIDVQFYVRKLGKYLVFYQEI